MKYSINEFGTLIISNDLTKIIFILNKNNYWYKYDYNQYGNEIYYRDSSGGIENYE